MVIVCRLKSRTLDDQEALCVAQKNFETFRTGLEYTYSISLPAVHFKTLTHFKSFCVGLLETRLSDHPWSRSISPLKLRDRLSIAGSLFLFRKVLPAASPNIDDFFEKMSQPASPAPDDYYRFVSIEMKRMFPFGWDKGWFSKVVGTTLSPSSCLERSRAKGGNLGMLLPGVTWFDRTEFCATLMDKYKTFRPNVDRVKVVRAAMDGKERLVTVNSVDMTFLSPFHQLLYDRISEFGWCLRGEANVNRFRSFTREPGEVFVSGDYESATDNLNQDVARHILDCLSRTCTRVPLSIRESARRSLSCVAYTDCGKEALFKRGQLMGNSMSFPLLCLQNYLAFKYCIRRDVPVKINGDDIVFRSTLEECNSWKESVRACGLTLSPGKTLVSKNYFSLNSTFFVSGSKNVKLAPVIRSTAIFKPPESLEALKGRLDTLRGFRKDRRDFWTIKVLKKHSGLIWWNQRSLEKCDISVPDFILKSTGLLDREIFYTNLPKGLDTAPRSRKFGYFTRAIPEGWVRERGKEKDPDVQREFFRLLVENCWNPSIAASIPSSDRGSICCDLRHRFSYRRVRLLGVLTRTKFCTWLRADERVLRDKKKGEPYWVREKKILESPTSVD